MALVERALRSSVGLLVPPVTMHTYAADAYASRGVIEKIEPRRAPGIS